jgi:predicted phosphodiesterase
MTRLLILSDLHLEFAAFTPPDPDIFDIAVIAGDTLPGPKVVRWLQRPATFAGKPVILVPGNHEYYGGVRGTVLAAMRELAKESNVYLLDRDQVTIDGLRFLGCTLWTDFAVDKSMEVDEAMREAHGLSDFQGVIREEGKGHRIFTPRDALIEHNDSRRWLLERLREPCELKTIVVTHHAPSIRSMAPQFEGSSLNPCFYSDLPNEFFAAAEIWIHGHSHASADYVHGATRIVANPRGYRRRGVDENENFKRDLVIDV